MQSLTLGLGPAVGTRRFSIKPTAKAGVYEVTLTAFPERVMTMQVVDGAPKFLVRRVCEPFVGQHVANLCYRVGVRLPSTTSRRMWSASTWPPRKTSSGMTHPHRWARWLTAHYSHHLRPARACVFIAVQHADCAVRQHVWHAGV